jgi:repressor LexA
VIQYLDALERAGVITRGDGPRNIRIVRQASMVNTVGVPVIGRVAAGQPILAEENIVDEIQVDRAMAASSHQYYFLVVQGDSMDRAGIQDGDYLLVRYQEVADDGAIVVVLMDDSATVKRLRRSRDVAILQPVSSNPMHRPIVVGTDFMIQGVVVASLPREQLMS